MSNIAKDAPGVYYSQIILHESPPPVLHNLETALWLNDNSANTDSQPQTSTSSKSSDSVAIAAGPSTSHQDSSTRTNNDARLLHKESQQRAEGLIQNSFTNWIEILYFQGLWRQSYS